MQRKFFGMLVTLLNNPAFSPAHIATTSRRCAVRASESAVATREDTFAAKKAALIAGLEREYATFFQPMETELYSPDVEFVDPLINLNGVDAYANNVGMLAGSTLAGKILDNFGGEDSAADEKQEQQSLQ